MIGPIVRGMILPIDGGGGPVRFQWNPESLDTQRSAGYAELKAAGGDMPWLQFGCGDTRTIRLELRFTPGMDGPNQVKSTVEKLEKLTEPSAGSGSVKRPPRVMFMLGSSLRKMCVVREVSAKYDTYFDSLTLSPYFARVNVTLWEVKQ